MQVILLENISKLGKIGDQVSVKNGCKLCEASTEPFNTATLDFN